MLSQFAVYCTENPFFSLMLCLGLGFCLGKIRTGEFPMNAAIETIKETQQNNRVKKEQV